VAQQWTRGTVSFGLGLILVLMSGCKRDERPAPDYKFSAVKGKVIAGEAALTQGSVSFQPINDPNFVATGEIKPDGTFVLSTTMLGKSSPGAPEGEYRVTINVPQTSGSRPIGPFPVAENLTVKPGENEFILKIPPVKLP
jgi:hypothetical protein